MSSAKRQFFFILILLISASGVAQSGSSYVPPSGGLPRVLSECDLGPGATVCGMWTWNGSAYDGAWVTGASGLMTVASAAPGAIVMKRVDTVGPSAGLTGTYTGTWTGKAMTDAKLSWAFQGKTMEFAWSAVSAIAPVFCWTAPPPAQPYILNLYPAGLTAYTFAAEPNEKGARMNTSRESYDIRLPASGDGKIYAPVQRFRTVNDVNCSNASAYGYPSHVSLAIFSDGAAFGDRAAIAAIMTERNRRQRDYKQVYDVVCTLGQQRKNLTEIAQALDQKASAPGGSDAASNIERNFSRHPARTAADVQSRIVVNLKLLKDARDGLLADPVKDEHGKLYITDLPDDAACPIP